MNDRIDDARAQRTKRRQQRKDTRRRVRQISAYLRLQQLLTIKHSNNADEERKSDERDADDDKQQQVDSRLKMQKADILYRTAARIQQLEQRVAELTSSRCRRAGLESSHFVHSSSCVVLTYVSSGVIADASERYLQHAGFERSWYVGRRFLPPLAVLAADPLYLTRPSSDHSNGVLCRRPSDGGVEESRVVDTQYTTTVRLLSQLYSAEVDVIEAVWRTTMGDGLKYDSRVTSWVSEWEQCDSGSGCGSAGDVGGGGRVRSRKQPCFMVSVVSSCDRVSAE